MPRIAESVVKDAALAWLESLSYVVLHSLDIASGMPAVEPNGTDCREVVLDRRFRLAQLRLNPTPPNDAPEQKNEALL